MPLQVLLEAGLQGSEQLLVHAAERTCGERPRRQNRAIERLVTPRLVVRRFRPDDLDKFLAFHAHPEIASTMGKPPMDEAAAAHYLAEQAVLPATERGRWHGFGIESEGGLVGEVGFFLQRMGDEADLGFVLRPDVQGRGLATEAARALASFALGTLDLHRITAHCDEGNAPSWRVMERLGMRRVDAEQGRAYAIERQEWEAPRAHA